MQNLLLIANPAASGFTGGLHRRVVGILRRAFEVEAVWPTTADEVEALARQAASRGVEVVAAMGGDGVVHHVVNGIAGTPTALGIIPAGTTNVLARIFEIPTKPVAAARFLARPHGAVEKPLARISVGGTAATPVRYATFATGIGLDAEAVRAADLEPYRKYRLGGIHYARTAATVVVKGFVGRQPHLRVVSGSRRADAVSVLVQVHAPYTYFGRIPLAVTRRHPQRLAALVIEKISLLKIPSIVAHALLGRDLDRIRGLQVWDDVESLEVAADPPGQLQADGESLGPVSEAVIEAAPATLRVIAPVPGDRPVRAWRRVIPVRR